MSRLGSLLQVWPAERHEQAIDAERTLRAALPVVRRVGFAALRGGTGCSTAASGVADALTARRDRQTLLVDATDDELRLTENSESRPAAHVVPSPVWPGGVDHWREHCEERHRAHEITLTDWGTLDQSALSAVAAHSHVLCLTTSVERSAVQDTVDTASVLIAGGTPTVIVASAVRGRATPAARRMLSSSPVRTLVLPFDRGGHRSGATSFALSMLSAEIVRLCGRPRETRIA
ncbi:hypothetical protein [Microbacterium sp. SA39]|uniref:hypothetical protein n=1 Tax=Microbacterium sp. SA39 TaxID=1263625 RepID=UPI0005F9F9D7|nr:hypothetical protein [Microbacterium sp. SA39]KJQ54615.1 hypothetical protein RS85_01769 [Microbacterium sp. SA39]